LKPLSAEWQISAGFLAELARPALFATAALASAGVLADSRRHFRPRAVALWTAFTLFLPHVTLPLYLIARSCARPPATAAEEAPPSASADANDEDNETNDLSPAATTDTVDDHTVAVAPPGASYGVTDGITDKAAGSPSATSKSQSPRPRFARRLALPLLYAAALLGAGALYFYADYQSADAHLARARQAKLDRRGERAVLEYRAALRREDDPHVRKLLGLELSKAGRWEEALAELRAAERGGEPDDLLPFHIATALAALDRPSEASDHYRKFLQSQLCAQTPPDRRCEGVRLSIAP
jgi:tetratricopeptide (TPR) repeat protein